MEYINNIYVINMDESTDRLQNITTQMSKLNLPFTRVPAVNGKKLSNEQIKYNTTTFCRYFCTYSMIGCFLSHKKIWETIVNNNESFSIIMEDDCELTPTFKQDLQNVLDELIPHNPDFVYLGCFGGCEYDKKNYSIIANIQSRLFPHIKSNNNINLTYSYVPETPIGTHCYIVSNKGAKKLLQIMDKVHNHVDVTLLLNSNHLNVFASKKKLGFQSASAEQSTQSTFKFPVTLNYIFDRIHDNNNITYSFYFSSPIYEIFKHPINIYLLLACAIAIFTPLKSLLYYFTIFFILEFLIQPKNISIIIHWMFFIYSIIYIRSNILSSKK